jgi:hypothetical protein
MVDFEIKLYNLFGKFQRYKVAELFHKKNLQGCKNLAGCSITKQKIN